MDDDERRLLRDSLAQTFTTASPGSLRDALREFGFFELLTEDAETAVSVVAELEGRHLPAVSLLDDIVGAAAGLPPNLKIVYPDLGHSEPTSHVSKQILHVRGVLAVPLAERYLVPAYRNGEFILVTTPLPEAVVSGDDGLDPDSDWRAVSARAGIADAAVLDGDAAVDQWRLMRAAGHRALAHQLARIGRCMLELALDHVRTRRQFGHALGSFQAVKHALADVSLWAESTDLAAAAAWEDGAPESAQLAKMLAGRLIRIASANCQQVLGGMGFTWEHRFHHYLRRAMVLEPLLGSAVHLRSEFGRQVRTSGTPEIVHL